MKKLSVTTFSIFTLLSTFLLSGPSVANATTVPPAQQATSAQVEETDVQFYFISNQQAFNAAESAGINVKSILGEDKYKAALRQDMLRTGSSWIKTYKVGKETRISIGVNSAIVKTWKYGGRAAIYAIQAYGAVVGLPLDAMVANGMHNQLKSVNGNRGHQWEIGTKPWRIISSRTQMGGGGRGF